MKKLIWSFLFVLITVLSFAQISVESTPPSFANALLQAVPVYELPTVNEVELRAEDALEQTQNKVIPLRFGQDFSVELNLENSGVWETLPNGDKVWRLEIQSQNAKSLNFIFSDFYMPKGGEFFIYNKNKTYLIGAFTALNNKNHGGFSTAPVKGNSVILEYYEPKSVQNQGRIEVSKIIHAYRDMFATADDYIQSLAEGFGDAASCNVDINCATGANWQDEKRSVAMVLTSGNTRWCSGAMVNNAAQDTTPYFLTAEHCLDGNEATWMFIFNYESPTCSGTDGNLTKSISGSTTRASYQHTDFALLELSVKPPDNYLVYYAGWNNSGIPNTGNTTIHHPSGDVKKISVDNNSLVQGQNYNTDHWRVQNWEIGTTQGGSSGAPLFDANHRIIGQLHGGLASCNNTQYDEFGKFSASWLGGGTNETQLKHWLDPNNINQPLANGQYFVAAAFANNVKVSDVNGLTSCGNVFYPKVIVENLGSNTITNLEIAYQYAGYGQQIISWTGNLAWLQTVEIPIPGYSLPIGNQSLTIDVTVPNTTDEDVLDNSFTNNFTVTTTNSNLIINLKTDAWPEEINYRIEDNNGNAVFQVFSSQITGSAFENTLLTETVCLPSGCYKAIIEDDFDDGLSGGLGSAPGYFEIVSNGSQIGIINGDFGGADTILFCLPNGNLPGQPPVSTQNIIKNKIEINVFPNPTDGLLQFETKEKIVAIYIFDMLGRRVGAIENPTTNQLDLSTLDNGIYIVQFQFENEWVNRKVVVE